MTRRSSSVRTIEFLGLDPDVGRAPLLLDLPPGGGQVAEVPPHLRTGAAQLGLQFRQGARALPQELDQQRGPVDGGGAAVVGPPRHGHAPA